MNNEDLGMDAVDVDAGAAREPGSLSDAGDGTSGQGADMLQFVTFMAGDEVFAVDMAPVQEIIRVPEVVRVPMAPSTLEGLANLRGQVLPIVSLRRMFGFEDRTYDDATRALVVNLGQPLGFVVDRVSSVVSVEAARLEALDAIQGTIDTALLAGVIKDVGGHPMIMVLDFAKLIAHEFAALGAIGRTAGVSNGSVDLALDADTVDEAAAHELQLVSFDVAGQEYAITIEDVQEIVQVPSSIVHVPHSDAHVLGVMMLRNRLLPLVCLRRMFALPPQEVDESSRIVVVAVGGTSIGIVMDNVNEVLRVRDESAEPVPGLFTRNGSLSDISMICRLDDGKRLVSIIDARSLFRHPAIEEALTTVTHQRSDAASSDLPEDEAFSDDEQVVIFRLGKEEFGVPIDTVQEIVRVPDELTLVPKAPACVEGVINLRGAVLPVIDLRRRLGLPAVDRSDRQRVMVFLLNGVCTGFIVDSVAEVLKIHKSAIETAPQLSADQGMLLGRVANLEGQKRMVQLVAPLHLVEGHELAGLASMAA